MKESVIEDLRWFGSKEAHRVLRTAETQLGQNPLTETRNLKRLRPNPVAERELRLFGKYRVLFNVDIPARSVVILLVGEKRGNSLFVRGKEFTAHHESHPPERGEGSPE